MQNTVIGVFDNYSQAQSAMNALTASGFSQSQINLSPQQETHEARQVALRSSQQKDEGWSIGNFFRSMFGSDEPDEHSDVYHEAVRRGSYLLTVEADSDEQRDQAADIMNRYDPIDIDERSSQWRSAGWSGYDRNAVAFSDDEITRDRSTYSTTGTTRSTGLNKGGGTLEGEARLPVVEEELRVGKRVVQRGGVRIYQRVSERPVQESVNLREEEVHVERHKVDKPATQADLDAFKEGEMELRETAEEPVVSKTARVVEEVVVGKDVKERTETVSDTVRRTDVDVEKIDAGDTTQRGTKATRTTTTSTTSNTNVGMSTSADYEQDYRKHWQSSFANQGGRYEEYEPAYRYGAQLRNNESYKGYQWNQVEPEARRDWESKNPGSTWEKTKDAVRHAWERTTR